MSLTTLSCETYHEGESVAKYSDRNPEEIEVFVDCSACSVEGMLYDKDYDI